MQMHTRAYRAWATRALLRSRAHGCAACSRERAAPPPAARGGGPGLGGMGLPESQRPRGAPGHDRMACGPCLCCHPFWRRPSGGCPEGRSRSTFWHAGPPKGPGGLDGTTCIIATATGDIYLLFPLSIGKGIRTIQMEARVFHGCIHIHIAHSTS